MSHEYLIPDATRDVLEECRSGMGRQDGLAPSSVRPDLNLSVAAEFANGLNKRSLGGLLLIAGLSLASCGGVAVAVSQVAELLNPSGPSIADVAAHELATRLDRALSHEGRQIVRGVAADLDLQDFGCLETVRDEPWPDGTIKHNHTRDCPLQGGSAVWATFSSPESSSSGAFTFSLPGLGLLVQGARSGDREVLLRAGDGYLHLYIDRSPEDGRSGPSLRLKLPGGSPFYLSGELNEGVPTFAAEFEKAPEGDLPPFLRRDWNQ